MNKPNADPALITDHNQEARAVWEAFGAGQPIRPPVMLGTASQFFIFNDDLNPGEAVTFEQYCTDAKTMLDFQLRAAAWRGEHIAPYCDDPIGLPEAFEVRVDLQNFNEAAYFGAPVEFIPHQVPDTRPILAGDRKNALFDAGLPNPLTGGWYAQAHRICAEMAELIAKNPTYLDRPIRMTAFGVWTDGPLTTAIALRGHEFLTDFYEDPDYARALLNFITEANIARIKAHFDFFGLSNPDTAMFFADDSIQLISTKMLREFLLPVYRKLKAEITTAEKIKVHLCGDASRHFKILKDELGCNDFETGFPIDFGKIRAQLGPEVTIHGGPNIMLLRNGAPADIAAETRRILQSGVLAGGKFVLREGNNLAPLTPFANLDAMYQTARGFAA